MTVCSRSGDITIQLFENSRLLPGEWQQLLPEQHFLDIKNLSFCEHTVLPDVSFLYALISMNKRCVAAAYFQVLHVKDYHLNTAQLSWLQTIGWKALTGLWCTRLLVAGHLFRHDVHSFYYKQDLNAYDAFRCYHAAINSAMKQAGTVAALIKDMPQELSPYFQNYAPEYLLQRNDISMEMLLAESWNDIQDYEKALKHKYAQRFRKIRSLWQHLMIKELDIAETEQHKGIIFGLYKQVTNKQLVRLGILNEDYLPGLKKQQPDDLRLWMVYEKEKPIAFISAWTATEVFDMFYIGFDYERNEALQLYFNILFFSIEQAIAQQKKKLILGRTALEAKARLGCKPCYLSTFVYINNRMLRNFVAQLQSKIGEQEGEWENRHPFKSH